MKNKPVTFKTSVNDAGNEVVCQCRLKVLTSQHEGSFFRIRITAKPPPGHNSTKTAMFPTMEVLSAPYKVISKPEQRKLIIELNHKGERKGGGDFNSRMNQTKLDISLTQTFDSTIWCSESAPAIQIPSKRQEEEHCGIVGRNCFQIGKAATRTSTTLSTSLRTRHTDTQSRQ